MNSAIKSRPAAGRIATAYILSSTSLQNYSEAEEARKDMPQKMNTLRVAYFPEIGLQSFPDCSIRVFDCSIRVFDCSIRYN